MSNNCIRKTVLDEGQISKIYTKYYIFLNNHNIIYNRKSVLHITLIIKPHFLIKHLL